MNELLERLRRDDPSALEEVGHQLLPFVQAALLGQALQARDTAVVLQAFKEAVTYAQGLADSGDFTRAVVQRVRDRAEALAVAPADPALTDALQTLARLQPLPVSERELVVARFVERLTAPMICEQFGVEASLLREALGRGATALLGPPASAPDWTAEPSLTDPDCAPAPQFVELENLLSALAVDVTALERQPLLAAMPTLKPGFVASQVPAEHYPSHVATQAAIDLPSQMSAAPQGDPAARAVDVVAFRPRAEPGSASGPTPPPQPPAPEVTPRLAQPAPEVTPRLAQAVPEVTPRLAQPAPEVTPRLAQAVPEVTPRLAERFVDATRPDAPIVPEVTPRLAEPIDRDATSPRGAPVPISMLASNWQPAPVGAGSSQLAEPAEEDPGQTRLTFQALPPPTHWPRPRTLWAATGSFAALAVGLYFAAFSRLDAVTHKSWNLVEVMVAASPLQKGQVLTFDMVAPRLVPATITTVSIVQRDLLPVALGETLIVDLEPGEPLRWTAFKADVSRQRLRVERKARAYAIPVSVIEGVGGMVGKGDRADLILNLRDVADAGTRAITVMQDASVLAVGPFIDESIGRLQLHYANVSLLLLPEEAEALSEALAVGTLTMTLRSPTEDHEPIEPGLTTPKTLIDGERLKQLQARQNRVPAPQIIRSWSAGPEHPR